MARTHTRTRLSLTVLQAAARLWLAILIVAPGLWTTRPAFAVGLLAPIDPLLQQQMLANPLQQLPVIVEMNSVASPLLGANVQLAQQALALLQLNGRGQAALPLIGSAAGLANAAGITALRALPGVAVVHFDAPVRARATATVSGANLATAYPRTVNADAVWSLGSTGQGVGVAVLDSGITRDADFTQPTNRIVATANFADALGSVADPGGHGTHVAGTIAGNGWRSNGQYVGVAPEANLIDVRVLDGNGQGRMSSVILGIQWALAHRIQYNIRVLNLSLGAQAPVNYRLDPLSAAVEMAWLRGVVVVAAAGNTGGAPDSPGADPLPITVGATDDRQTAAVGDDVLNSFSAYGTPAGSTAKPDVVAPGRRIVATRAPGSTLDRLLPERVVTATNGATYFRLTGTSMSTAVVSGVVALLLQRQPGLSPDQVKAILKGTARPFGQTSGARPNPAAIGAGLVNAYAAVTSGGYPPANRGIRVSDPAARSLYPALVGHPVLWRTSGLLGGSGWSLLSWNNIAWDNIAWDNIAWDNIAWDNIAWDNIAWDNIAWDTSRWSNIAWDNIAWDSLALD